MTQLIFLTGFKCKSSWSTYLVSARALKTAWNHNHKAALPDILTCPEL